MSKLEINTIQQVCEAAMMAAGSPLSIDRLLTLFDEDGAPTKADIVEALARIKQDCADRGVELIEVASGFRLQVRSTIAPFVARLWEEKPQRYSRALMETLALIAYRQPITRGDIEDVRGVVVSSNMIKTLTEREWIRVVGYRDVPGRPAMYATTHEFLDYFGLSSLDQLPTLTEIKELDDQNRHLALGEEANAKQQPAADYQFSSDEEIAQRGAAVMDATDDDLQQANQLISQVEDNVYEEDAENGGRRVRDLGQILERLAENSEADVAESESLDLENSDTEPSDNIENRKELGSDSENQQDLSSDSNTEDAHETVAIETDPVVKTSAEMMIEPKTAAENTNEAHVESRFASLGNSFAAASDASDSVTNAPSVDKPAIDKQAIDRPIAEPAADKKSVSDMDKDLDLEEETDKIAETSKSLFD